MVRRISNLLVLESKLFVLLELGIDDLGTDVLELVDSLSEGCVLLFSF